MLNQIKVGSNSPISQEFGNALVLFTILVLWLAVYIVLIAVTNNKYPSDRTMIAIIITCFFGAIITALIVFL